MTDIDQLLDDLHHGRHVSLVDLPAMLNELARFRSMFPVLPWDDSPVTTEVCERLGLLSYQKKLSPTSVLTSWHLPEEPTRTVASIETYDSFSEPPWITGLVQDGRKATAGNLACLVAARRAAT